jgi:hypothetical protein|nr:MAG TPA: hypothetical protein [Caudoviricetes sp.]
MGKKVMTKKTIYIANDGTEFETKEECEYYENRYKALLDNPEVVFFDYDLKPLTKYNIRDAYDWCELFENSYCINIPSVECFTQLIDAYDEFLGMSFASYDSKDKLGVWRYNHVSEYWENLIKIKVETDKIIQQVNEIVLSKKV